MSPLPRVDVIASDLDGTLFGPDHQLAAPTISALQRARAAGIKVVAATGRAPRSAMERLAPHDVVDALICSNGSIIHDVETDETVHRFPIATDLVAALFDALDRGVGDLSFCWELDNGSAWDPAFEHVAREHDDLHTYSSGPRPDGSRPITKVMAYHAEFTQVELAETLRPHLPGPLTLGCSGVDFVEITGVGVDKSTALTHLAHEWGIDRSVVIAFGDNHNDVEMLSWAGHGVAVANAADSALDAADEVIGHHGDHAVARYVDTMVGTLT